MSAAADRTSAVAEAEAIVRGCAEEDWRGLGADILHVTARLARVDPTYAAGMRMSIARAEVETLLATGQLRPEALVRRYLDLRDEARAHGAEWPAALDP